MTFTSEDHPEAREEFLDAVDYYDRQRAGLGSELIERFDLAVKEIEEAPEAWPMVPDWDSQPVVRSHRVQTFRYRVVYYVRDDKVIIVAYAHTSREPGYWRHRVQGSSRPPATDRTVK